MIRHESTRHLTLAPPLVTVIEANGHVYLSSGGTSIEVPLSDIPRIVAALLVAEDRIGDAS